MAVELLRKRQAKNALCYCPIRYFPINALAAQRGGGTSEPKAIVPPAAVYLGRGFTAASADRIAKIVTDIIAFRKRGETLSADLVCRSAVLPERIRKNIERLGLLVDCRQRSLGDLLAAQYETKKHLKPRTLAKYREMYKRLIEFFGVRRKLITVTKSGERSMQRSGIDRHSIHGLIS